MQVANLGSVPAAISAGLQSVKAVFTSLPPPRFQGMQVRSEPLGTGHHPTRTVGTGPQPLGGSKQRVEVGTPGLALGTRLPKARESFPALQSCKGRTPALVGLQDRAWSQKA